jgi:hypothetical protein
MPPVSDQNLGLQGAFAQEGWLPFKRKQRSKSRFWQNRFATRRIWPLPALFTPSDQPDRYSVNALSEAKSVSRR